MATAATIKKNIAKLEAALKSKATPKTLKPKLEAQLVKSKAELSGIKKGTKPKTSSTKSTQTALQKLKEMVNKNKKFKTYKGAGVDLEKDADRPALRTGKRIAKESGKTYYEYRANRIDVKQPPKKYPKLEKGGYMADGGETLMMGDEEVYIKKSSIGLEDEVCLFYKKDDSILKCISKNQLDKFIEQGKLVPKKEKGGYYADGGELADIDKAKKSLISKAKSKGIYENFGQNEVRTLQDKYGYTKAVADFDNWAMNFDLSQMEQGGYMADGGMIYKMADNMTDAEYEKKFSGLNEKQKKTYESLVRLGDSPKLALATTLLSNEVKYSEDTTRAYTMAKGGLTEHGLKVGDTIVDNMFWDKSVKVLNSKTGYAVVHLETGERKEMKAMGGEMHRTQE